MLMSGPLFRDLAVNAAENRSTCQHATPESISLRSPLSISSVLSAPSMHRTTRRVALSLTLPYIPVPDLAAHSNFSGTTEHAGLASGRRFRPALLVPVGGRANEGYSRRRAGPIARFSPASIGDVAPREATSARPNNGKETRRASARYTSARRGL